MYTLYDDKNESGIPYLHCLELRDCGREKGPWREKPGGDEPKIFFSKTNIPLRDEIFADRIQVTR